MPFSYKLLRAAAALAVVLVGGAMLGGPRSDQPSVGGSSTRSATPSASIAPSPMASPEPLDTATWTPYTSRQYGFTLGHPADWIEVPATRAWTFEDDGMNWRTPAADAFYTPVGSGIRVSAWLVPFEPGAVPEQSWEDVQAWIEAYCPKTDITPCDVIQERAEHLCVEIRDCHPGLLVPFDDAVQAFFFGGVSVEGGMTVVSVWWKDGAAATAPYGGSKRLLEAFLGTMNVWPEGRRPSFQDSIWPPPSPASP